ncbi:MAG: hypothetical protein ACTHOH_03880 [Lysobacteraceae bacterium]
MSHAGHLWNITVIIEGGVARFDPPPGKQGYQFAKNARRGVIVFTLASDDYRFSGCNYTPQKGDFPGIEARWGHATRNPGELVVTFTYPEGVVHDGHLRLEYMRRSDKITQVVDPQVGNDGQTGGFLPP